MPRHFAPHPLHHSGNALACFAACAGSTCKKIQRYYRGGTHQKRCVARANAHTQDLQEFDSSHTGLTRWQLSSLHEGNLQHLHGLVVPVIQQLIWMCQTCGIASQVETTAAVQLANAFFSGPMAAFAEKHCRHTLHHTPCTTQVMPWFVALPVLTARAKRYRDILMFTRGKPWTVHRDWPAALGRSYHQQPGSNETEGGNAAAPGFRI